MSKRSFSDIQTCSQTKKPKCEEQDIDINLILTNIFVTLNKINTKIESCEKKIAFIHECQVKLEEEKIERKMRDTEIFNSYIS
jgi:hypothetical protein